MREILFRGKRVDTGEWCYGVPLVEGWRKTTYIASYEYSSLAFVQQIDVDPETIGQFTGLTDKNGKRIWEGDILQEFSEYEDKPIGEKRVVRYGFDQTDIISVYGFSPCDKNGKPTGDLWLGSYYEKNVAEEVVVVGNVHDNPELLTAERIEDNEKI